MKEEARRKSYDGIGTMNKVEVEIWEESLKESVVAQSFEGRGTREEL